ncbi:translocation protein TolB [Desulfovibrio sp. OttesenSCG-928-A18]|nr:translocation protein TolB [Desulfovibrio sp. OttesenSCG-928-A18]
MKRTMSTPRKQPLRMVLTLMACLVFCSANIAAAAPYTVEVVGAGSNMVNVVQATPMGETSRAYSLQQAIDANLSLIPFIAVIGPSGIPGGAEVPSASGEGADFKRFAMANAHMLITSNWLDSSQVELRCFEVTEGRFMFGSRYSVGGGEEGLYDVADEFCAEFLKAVIGRGDFFSSMLAFVKSDGVNKMDIWCVQPNGRRLSRLTNMRGEAISPAWSPDGRRVVFTHIDKRSHGLGIYDVVSKSVQRIKFAGNTVIGPTFLPDGRVAVSLTDGRNPSIFRLGHGMQKESKLDDSSAIDVSPSLDASGLLMAFTSNRLGNPHVFLKDFRNGMVRRISQSGTYNTDPSISPDGTLVAFARREGGGHRIFVQDLVTGQERQLTFGPGSDEEPCFAPDSYFIAFMSTRNGQKEIYITTRNGGQARRLPTGSGDASFPAWGPAAR